MWLVTHASGTIGKAVVTAGAARGQRLRLMVRGCRRYPRVFARERT